MYHFKGSAGIPLPEWRVLTFPFEADIFDNFIH